jgi:hypothetical protein
MEEHEAVERAVLLLVSGMSLEAAVETLKGKLGLSPRKAEAVAKKAQKKIVLAANYDKTQELGTAIARLNDLYRRAVAIQDTKTALAIQRELNKLLDLYDRPVSESASTNDDETIAREYLIKLGLGDETTPLPELCRRAAARIIDLQIAAP